MVGRTHSPSNPPTNRQIPRLCYVSYWRRVNSVKSVRLAGVAQLVEQLPCKQQVNGSSPFASFSVKLFFVNPRELSSSSKPLFKSRSTPETAKRFLGKRGAPRKPSQTPLLIRSPVDGVGAALALRTATGSNPSKCLRTLERASCNT